MSNKFRVEDITFHGSRKQSEIEKEILNDKMTERGVEAPVSHTPEQIVNYFNDVVEVTTDPNLKALYMCATSIIQEVTTSRQKIKKLEAEVKTYEAKNATRDTDTGDLQ